MRRLFKIWMVIATCLVGAAFPAFPQVANDPLDSLKPWKGGTASWSEATAYSVTTIGATPAHAIRIERKF